MNAQSAKYKVGDRLHFTPSAIRAPHGTAIDEGDVIVTEVVDHGSPTPYSPRFTYVVRALNGSGTQGTDDRELTEITIPAIADEMNAQRTLHLANAGQALPGDVIGVDTRGERRVIGEIIQSGSGWEVFDADGSDWGYWGPTETLTVYRPQSTSGKCADCDAPGVRMDHGDGGPGSDFSVKLRCERHSRPAMPVASSTLDDYEPSALVDAAVEALTHMREMGFGGTQHASASAMFIVSAAMFADLVAKGVAPYATAPGVISTEPNATAAEAITRWIAARAFAPVED